MPKRVAGHEIKIIIRLARGTRSATTAPVVSAYDAVAAMVYGFGLCCLLWVPAYCFERAKEVLNTVGSD